MHDRANREHLEGKPRFRPRLAATGFPFSEHRGHLVIEMFGVFEPLTDVGKLHTKVLQLGGQIIGRFPG